MLLMVWGLLGCDDDARLPTEVHELRIVTAVVSPPEVLPGQTVEVTVHLANPDGVQADLLVWPCLRLEDACLEYDVLPQPLSTWTRLARDVGGETTFRWDLPAFPIDIVSEQAGTLATGLWVLACEPGACPVIDAVAADPAVDSPAWRDTTALLADPETWIREAPIERSSLAVRTLLLSTREPLLRNDNPLVTPTSDGPVVAKPGEELALRFTTTDAVQARPLTTVGVFGSAQVPIRAGVVGLSWVAPAEPGTGRMWVVFEDGLGGNAVWTQTVEVR